MIDWVNRYLIKRKFRKKNALVYTINLNINHFVIQINTNDLNFYTYVSSHYNQFFSNLPPQYVINVYQNTSLKKILFEEENFKYTELVFDEVFYYRQSKRGELIDLILPVQYKDWEIDNFFKLHFSSRCLNHNMLLLHASVIIKENKAIIFSGPSGTGKSTIAQLSGEKIIHDDIIAVSINGSNVSLSTIPFKTSYQKRTFEGKIAGFYRLHQAKETYVKELNEREQFVELLFSVWSYDNFKITNTNKYDKDVVDYCKELKSLFPVQKLYFTKSTEFLNYI